MKTLLILFVLVFSAIAEPPAKPTIGMTPEELLQKYGQGVDVKPTDKFPRKNPPAERAIQFYKNGVNIVVQIWKGKAVSVSYYRAGRFTVAEQETLLANQSAGWKISGGTDDSTMWSAEGLVACYMQDSVSMLVIQTVDFYSAIRAEVTKGLKGL